MKNAILGESRDPNNEEEEFLLKMQSECPVRLFQLLNKLLNSRGFMLHISSIGEGGSNALL